MAFLLKNEHTTVGSGKTVVEQWIHVSRSAKTIPQTTNEVIFDVRGGRVLVHMLLGEVTTEIEGTNPVPTVGAARTDSAGALVGTVYVIASTIDMSSNEVGTIYTVEGDGTAIVSPQLAGAGIGANGVKWIMPNGEIYFRTTASKTGAIKWDIWYQPLDEGAYVVAAETVRAHIT